jgi:hypothetical protein
MGSARLCKLQKRVHSTTQSQVISLPVACPWLVVLSGYSASSTTKTGRNDIAEILLKVALSTKHLNRIGGIMISVLASSAIDLGFGQTKD